METQTTSNRGFSCFRVSGGPNGDFDDDGNPIRKRRKHTKSRAGCNSCKARRKKCDETFPSCQQCINKGRVCSLARLRTCQRYPADLPLIQAMHARPNEQDLSNLPIPHSYMAPSSIPWQASSSQLNILQMQLFHHFITYTTDTMIFGPLFWNCKVIPLALQFDFIMHAVLAIAASHLQYLKPYERTYHTLELHHTSESISLFRKALLMPTTPVIVNSLISCGSLLLHNSWGSMDIRDKVQEDYLFPLAAGLKRLIWETKHLLDPSFLDPMAICGPAASVIQYTEQTNLRSQLEEFLVCRYNRLKSPESVPEDDAAYISAARSLIPVLVIFHLDLAGHDIDDIRSDVAGYLFSWPAKSESELQKLLRNNYDVAQLLSFYYYSAALKLLPDKCWWARTRSKFFCELIFWQLSGKCEGGLWWTSDLHAEAEKPTRFWRE